MGRNGHLRSEKKVPLKKMHENHGFLHVQQLSGCLGTPRQASGAQFFCFYFFFVLDVPREDSAGRFRAQLYGTALNESAVSKIDA